MPARKRKLSAREAKLLIDTVQVSKVLGGSTDAARDWLKRTNAGVKRGGRWYTTRARLRAHFPELLDAIACHD